ncbi:hypothetical protein HOY82DRAFT_588926 [Tuber indicum]|nr:hypothetical protein HOY82DRAFT_588926 [Tuber indicum]
MSRLAKRFRFDRRNRATHRAGVPGSSSLPNAFSEPPSATQQAVNAVTFSMTMPPILPSGTGNQTGTDDSTPPDGLGNTERFLVTRVEDPRVRVLDDNGCAAANPTCQPGCTHEISDVTDALRALDLQKWLDEMPSTSELVAARDEILAALDFDHVRAKREGELLKQAEMEAESVRKAAEAARANAAARDILDSNPEEKPPTLKTTQSSRKRKGSGSAASSSTLSSIPTEYYYGCGYISPLDELEPHIAPPDHLLTSTPSLTVTQKPSDEQSVLDDVAGKNHLEPQAATERSKWESSILKALEPERKPSIANKLNFKFKGKPIFSSKAVPSTRGNSTEPTQDKDNSRKAHPQSLGSPSSSMASIDKPATEPDKKPGSKRTGAHNFFRTGRSPSSYFAAQPSSGNCSTDSDSSRAPVVVGSNSQLSSTPTGAPSTQKPSIGDRDAPGKRLEPAIPQPSKSNVTCSTGDTPVTKPASEILADLSSSQTTQPSDPNRPVTTISPPPEPVEAAKSAIESGANLDKPTLDKGKAREANISSVPSRVSEAHSGPKNHARSPLFDINKKSSLTALRIQLEFFNKMLGDIQKKIDKITIYQPTPALLERLRQLKHAHRGIIVTLGAAPILEDMKAVGYTGKLLADLEAFQARLDDYDWENEGDDPMANPFGLPAEPAWCGPQFEGD